jgi:hypothetical protein
VVALSVVSARAAGLLPAARDGGRKSLLPVCRERQQLADGLARSLAQLGMARQAKPVEDLQPYLARKAAETDAQAIGLGGE